MKNAGWSIAVVLALSACGGGGGGGNGAGDSNAAAVVSTLTFPIAAALSTYLQSSHQFNLIGSDSKGSTANATYVYTPQIGTTTFDARSVMSGTETLTQGATMVSTSTSYFSSSPLVLVGSSHDGQNTTADSPTAFPTSARVGQSGSLGTGTTTLSTNPSQVVYTETDGWSLEADTATTAWLCVSYAQSNGVSGKSCYQIDGSGNVLGIKGSATDSSGTSSYHS